MKKIFSFVFAIFLLLNPAQVFAIPASRLYFYDDNNIFYYNPEGGACDDLITVDPVDPGTGGGGGNSSSKEIAFMDMYHSIAEQLSIQYGIPWEAVMAQGILESASGTSRFARERNNFFGIGAFDSNPDNAFSYATPEEGWKGYYENIRKTKTYRAHGVFQGNTITDPYAYIQAVKDAGYATDANYVSKVSNVINRVKARAESQGWASSAELAQQHPEMLTNAAANAQGGSSGSSGGSGGSSGRDNKYSSDCISSGIGRNNGNINSTAVSLAWPDKSRPSGKTRLDATDAYYRATHLSNHSDQYVRLGASCDAFLATVMRYSGIDTDFPCCGASNAKNYMLRSANYTQITTNGTEGLQGGDILANDRHVAIVVEKDGKLMTAAASHGDHAGEIGNYVNTSGFLVFRHN